MYLKKHFVLTTAAAMLVSTAATAQIFGDEFGTDLTQENFNRGFAETGTFEAWDTDADAGLNENEFATGVFAEWDRDNDLVLTETEYSTGAERWGANDNAVFADADVDTSGLIERAEFRDTWDTNYYAGWDRDADNVLNQEEFGTGLYQAADANQNQVITVQEEGWFEGWFDGNEVEAEIQEVGDVLQGAQ